MLQLAEPELGVLLAGRVGGGQVLLVERDRLVAPTAELAESLCARERDSRAGRQRVRLRELVVGVRVLARLVQGRTLVEKRLRGGVVDRLVPGLGRAAKLCQIRLGVLLPPLFTRGEVLLVERDRLLAASAEPPQRLRGREDQTGAREERVRGHEVVVCVPVAARGVVRSPAVEELPRRIPVGGLVSGLGRPAQLGEDLLGVVLSRRVAGSEVLLVERDRLLPPPAQTAQRLSAREDDSRPVDPLAGARKEVVCVGEVSGAVRGRAAVEDLLGDRRVVAGLVLDCLHDGPRLPTDDPVDGERWVGLLELAHGGARDRPEDAVDGCASLPPARG